MFASFKINLILQEAEGADIFPKWIAVVVKLIIFRLIEMDWKKYSGLTFFGFRLFLLGRLILKIQRLFQTRFSYYRILNKCEGESGKKIWRKLKNHQIGLKYFNKCFKANAATRKLLSCKLWRWKTKYFIWDLKDTKNENETLSNSFLCGLLYAAFYSKPTTIWTVEKLLHNRVLSYPPSDKGKISNPLF